MTTTQQLQSHPVLVSAAATDAKTFNPAALQKLLADLADGAGPFLDALKTLDIKDAMSVLNFAVKEAPLFFKLLQDLQAAFVAVQPKLAGPGAAPQVFPWQTIIPLLIQILIGILPK